MLPIFIIEAILHEKQFFSWKILQYTEFSFNFNKKKTRDTFGLEKQTENR